MDKKRVRIISKLQKELTTKVEIRGQQYLVVTEDAKPNVITRVYSGGKVLSTTKTDYSSILNAPKLEDNIHELMTTQHRRAENTFKQEKAKEIKPPSEYLNEVISLLARKSYRNALALLSEGLERHPGDPFLLSYYGCLEAVSNKNYRHGIDTCKKAIVILKERLPFGEEFYYPSFYLNLGRAYLAADDKESALEAFAVGLKADPDNSDILWETRRLGMRRKPAVAFLRRSNPINKYIGILLRKLSK